MLNEMYAIDLFYVGSYPLVPFRDISSKSGSGKPAVEDSTCG